MKGASSEANNNKVSLMVDLGFWGGQNQGEGYFGCVSWVSVCRAHPGELEGKTDRSSSSSTEKKLDKNWLALSSSSSS